MPFPPSVPPSGFLSLSVVLARSWILQGLPTSLHHERWRFAAFFHAARVLGTSLQSFPFPRSRTRSREPLLPCGFMSGDRQRRNHRDLHDRFHAPRKLFAPREGRTSEDRGSYDRSLRSPRHTRECAARIPPFPMILGSLVSSQHAHFEALLLPGARSRQPLPWPGGSRRPLLSWDSFPPELPLPWFRVRLIASTCAGTRVPLRTHR